MKKVKIGMFGRVVLAIAGGVALGFLLANLGGAGAVGLRVLKTFNVIFGGVEVSGTNDRVRVVRLAAMDVARGCD